jgi:hypothetical protein
MDFDVNSPIMPALREATLEAFRVGATRRLSRQMIENTRLSTWTDLITQDLVIDLEAIVYAHKIAQDTIERDAAMGVAVPTSTWQFFKDAHACSWWFSWFTNRWPAKTRTITKTVHFKVDVRKYNAFPDAAIQYPPELGRPIQWIYYPTQVDVT